MPASESTLLRYLTYLSYKPTKRGVGLAPGSLQSILAAIRSMHILAGYPIPPVNSPRISLFIKGIARSAPAPIKKLPIEFGLLQKMWALLGQDFDSLALKALMALTYYGCLRGAEVVLVHGPNHSVLHMAPVLSAIAFGQIHSGMYLTYNVPASKTQIKGFNRLIGCVAFNNVVSQSKTFSCALCAVCSMWHYLRAHQKVGGSLPTDPLFIWSDATPINKNQFNNIIKQIVGHLHLDPKSFSSHSFRAGSVTMASHSHQPWLLKSMGGWSSEAYQGYLRNTGLQHLKLASVLAGHSK